jgi:type II secretion system protein I
MRAAASRTVAAFTLLEVMIAVAFIGIALIALLSLHHTDLQSVIRGRELTRAAMLGQALMSQAELERFPPPGKTRGDFGQLFPGEYQDFRWQREVVESPEFPNVERVRISVQYGPGLSRNFNLTEFMHRPAPPSAGGGPNANQNPQGAQSANQNAAGAGIN